jgi:SAM-dependent methyltransferase
MWDAWKGLESFEVVERDDGYVDSIQGSGYLAPFEAWPEHERKAMELVRGRVIDLGCGAGRVSLYLQERGFDVVGLDISRVALKVCRERGLRKVRLGSIQSLRLPPNSFDTAIFFGNNFGLVRTPPGAKRVLRDLHRILSDGGLILAETRDPYKTEEPAHLAYHKMNRRKGRLAGQIRMRVRYGQYSTPWFDWLILSRDELAGVAEGTGWKVGECLDSGGPQYVAVLRKV